MVYRRKRPREPVSRVLCPTELGGGHLSRAAVTRRLVRPTRELGGEQPPALCRGQPDKARARMLGLAPGGGCLAGRVTTPPVVSCATFSPSPAERPKGLSRWRSVSVALSVGRPTWGLPSTALYGARTFLTLRYGRAQPPGPLGQAHLSTQVVSRQEVFAPRNLGYLGEGRMLG